MKAPAKINLYLHITGKREDGYHFLDTLIAFTDIYDELEITPADKFSLEISGEFAHLVENNDSNIVSRACKMMADECGASNNFSIKLVKNIPVGAGLGGGSADAAATLILLNEILGAGFSKEKLAGIGVKLGADVPIFINRHAAFVSGIGEKINDTGNLPELYAILVYPNKFLSTKDVFVKFSKDNFGDAHSPAGRELGRGSLSNWEHENPNPLQVEEGIHNDWLSFLKSKRNDLENTAIEFLPEIKLLLADLAALKGCHFSRMSGSGSTCFAIFTDKNQAETATAELKSKSPGLWIKQVKVVQEY